MSLGIAACQAKQNYFTGKELYAEFKKISSQGRASGSNVFEAETGTRDVWTLKYQVDNIIINAEATTSTDIFLKMVKIKCHHWSQL